MNNIKNKTTRTRIVKKIINKKEKVADLEQGPELEQKPDLEQGPELEQKPDLEQGPELEQNQEQIIDEIKKIKIKKANLTNFFKSCLDTLRDSEGLTGDKALRTMAYILILRLSREHIENGTIKFDNLDDYIAPYNDNDYKNVLRYAEYVNFTKLATQVEAGITYKVATIWEWILSKHYKFRDLYRDGDSLNIKSDCTLKMLLVKFLEFPFEDYEEDIQGECYEEVIKDIMIGKILGQYFTNPLIKNFMIDLIKPQVKEDGKIETIFDPAMGTGGFLVSALRYIKIQATNKNINLDYDFVTKYGIGGRELDPDTFKLCKANMLISSGKIFDNIKNMDSIRNGIMDKYDIVLANPPFGIKGMNYTQIPSTGNPCKADYLPIESNSAIPLFIQMMIYILKVGGRCATVVPDGQDLFGKSKSLVKYREYLMKTCDLKEIIFMTDGLFNNTGVKTCVFYFTKKIETKDFYEKVKDKTLDIYHTVITKKHATEKVAFYDYDAYKKEKKLLIEVNIDKIAKNDYSLRYTDYLEKEEIKYSNDIQVMKLGDICNIQAGKFLSSECKKEGKYPFYTGKVNNPEGFSDNYCFDYEKYLILIKNGGAGKGKYGDTIGLGKVFYVEGKTGAMSSQYALVLKVDNVNIKYLYYYLQKIKNNIMDLAHYTTGLGIVSKKDIENIIIPVPTLEKQQELIKQLNFFYEESIQTSLKKIQELETNNKFIMNNITFLKNVQVMKLGDVCEFKNGNRIVKSQETEGIYPVYGSGYRTYNVNKFNREGKTCKIGRFGVSLDNCIILLNEKYYLNDSGLTIESKEKNILSEYIWYYLLMNKNLIYFCVRGAAQANLNIDEFKKISVPVITLQEQKIIADKINKNMNHINILKEEIEDDKNYSNMLFDNILNINTTEAQIELQDNNTTKEQVEPQDNNINEDQIEHQDNNIIINTTLQEIATLNIPTSIKDIKTKKDNKYKIPYYTATNINYCQEATYSGHHILCTRVTQNQGTLSLVDGEFSASSDFIIVKLKEEYTQYYEQVIEYIKNNFDYNKLIDEDPVYNTKNEKTSNVGLKHLKKFIINL